MTRNNMGIIIRLFIMGTVFFLVFLCQALFAEEYTVKAESNKIIIQKGQACVYLGPTRVMDNTYAYVQNLFNGFNNELPKMVYDKEDEKVIKWTQIKEGAYELRQVVNLTPEAVSIAMYINLPEPIGGRLKYGEMGYKIPQGLLKDVEYWIVRKDGGPTLRGKITEGKDFREDLLQQVKHAYQAGVKELILETAQGIFRYSFQVKGEKAYAPGIVDRRKADGSGYIGVQVGIPQKGAVSWQTQLRIEKLDAVPANVKITKENSNNAKVVKADTSGYKLDPKHYDIFYGKRKCIYLSDGFWKLKKLPDTESNPANDPGTKEGFYKPHFDDSAWDNQVVPWDWNERYPSERSWKGRQKPFVGVGWYRKHFRVPAEYEGQRLLAWFGSVDQDAVVYVNGHKVGVHRNYSRYYMSMNSGYDMESFEFDITENIKFGEENVLSVRVYDDGKGYPMQYRYANIKVDALDCGGIWQPVAIRVEPPVFARDIMVTPKLETSEIEVSCILINTTGRDNSIRPVVQLTNYKSERYTPKTDAPETTVERDEIKLKPGKNKYGFKLKLNSPVYWNDENPHLYLLSLRAGQDVRQNPVGLARFGFREIGVKGAQFLLNGKPVYLRGIDAPCSIWNRTGDVVANQGNHRYKHIRFLRDHNLNFGRLHVGWAGRAFYDVCDELGFMINNTLPRPRLHPPSNDKRPAWDTFFTKWDSETPLLREDTRDGFIKPWVYACYNHPSIIFYNLGNEPYDTPKVKKKKYLDPLYDLIKSLDATRPVAGFSGRWPWRDTVVKTDFYDVHEYVGGMIGSLKNYTQTQAELKKHRTGYLKQYGLNLPMINGECMHPPLLIDWWLRNITRMDLAKKTEITRKEHVNFLEGIMEAYKKKPFSKFSYTAELITIQAMHHSTSKDAFVAKKNEEMLARSYKRMIEAHRLSKDIAGFNMHSPHLRGKGSDVQKTVSRACAPLIIVRDGFDSHFFAGKQVELKICVINDRGRGTVPMEAVIEIIGSDGNKLVSKSVTVESLDLGQKNKLPCTLSIPTDASSGFYNLQLTLKQDDKPVSSNEYQLYILGQADRIKKLHTDKKIAIGLKSSPEAKKLRSILDTLDVKYAYIDNWSKLDEYDVLFIAGLRPSIAGKDHRAIEVGYEKIEEWINNGGRLVSLMHRSPDPIPGLPSSRLQASNAGEMLLADADIMPSHPLFKGIPQPCWDTWNGGYGGIFTRYIRPLSVSVLVRGGSHNTFGMVVAEAKAGNGVVLCSEVLALEKYGSDSVATRYMENLLDYVLGDEFDGRYAEKMRGTARRIREVKDISVGDVNCIDLREHVNMGFKDDVEANRKGGWTDQGNKDMRHFPVGRRKFLGVLFDIIDPAKNEGRACIVLHDKAQRPYFPGEVTIPTKEIKAKRLFFLVSAAWCGIDTGHIADIHMNYKAGTGFAARRTLQLVSGKNIVDWTDAGRTYLPDAKVAWHDINPACGWNTSVYLIEWENPEPHIEITHIAIASKGLSIPIVLGITAEKFSLPSSK